MFRIAKDNNIQAPLARTARSVRKKISEIKCFKKKLAKVSSITTHTKGPQEIAKIKK